MTQFDETKPLTFLGQTMSESEFRREFAAYATYVPLVRAGADTPHKVELEIWRQNQRRSSKTLKGRISKRRKAA